MGTVADARAAVAAAMSTVPGVTVRPRPTVRTPQIGDGWVTVTRVTPATFEACAATLVAFVALGADEAHAEVLLDEWAVPLVDAVTDGVVPASAVALEAATVVVGQSATPLYALTLTATVEVE